MTNLRLHQQHPSLHPPQAQPRTQACYLSGAHTHPPTHRTRKPRAAPTACPGPASINQTPQARRRRGRPDPTLGARPTIPRAHPKRAAAGPPPQPKRYEGKRAIVRRAHTAPTHPAATRTHAPSPLQPTTRTQGTRASHPKQPTWGKPRTDALPTAPRAPTRSPTEMREGVALDRTLARPYAHASSCTHARGRSDSRHHRPAAPHKPHAPSHAPASTG